MQHAVNQHFERKKRQKISQMLPANVTEQAADQKQKTQDLGDLMKKLTSEQNQELNAYMERIKQEYLMKILEQVNL